MSYQVPRITPDVVPDPGCGWPCVDPFSYLSWLVISVAPWLSRSRQFSLALLALTFSSWPCQDFLSYWLSLAMFAPALALSLAVAGVAG